MGLLDRFRGTETGRVAVVGLAGLPFSVARETDLLPTLAELADAGRATAVDSVLPPDESACWPALTAGVNPGRTGVYGLLDREVGTYDTYVPQGGDVQAPRIWDRAEAAGRSATVLNVPVTNPPQKEVARMAAGPQAPDVARGAHPQALREDLADSDYRVDVDATLGQDGDLEGLVADARATVQARFDAFERWADRGEPALFVGCLTAPDRLNHFAWDRLGDPDRPHAEAVRDVYRLVDERLAGLRDRLPPDVTLVLVGDHGFAGLEWEVDLNRWLAETGWLAWADDEPDRLAALAPETRAFALPQGRVYLAREGREPDGRVTEAEADAVREELAAALRELTGPDGEPVAAAVHRAETLYEGPHLDLAPDLVVVPEPGFDLTVSFAAGGPVFERGRRVGMHVPGDAPFAVDHPDADLTDAGPFDVAPTVLDLLGVEADPEEFDGRSRLARGD